MDLLRPIRSVLLSPFEHISLCYLYPQILSPSTSDDKHTFLLLRASSDDDDVALAGFFVRPCSYACAGVAVECGVAKVLHLGVSYFFLRVDHEDIACDGVHDEGVGDCGADVAGAEDGDLGGEFGV
jgi:hypothetical protein